MATGKPDSPSLSSKTEGQNLECWMGNLPAHLLNVPLHELSIPGSHNSGTYELNKEWEVGPDADQAVKSLSFLPMAKNIIFAWSKCQNLSITQQLKAGVRYFDIRAAYHEPSEELCFIHSLYGPKIFPCMEEVKSFLNDHEKEVVLLDFNHFYGMDLEHHMQLISYLTFVFDGMLCPYSPLSSLTLSKLREKGTRIIIFYGHSSVLSFTDLWPPNTILSAWANKMNVEDCLSYQEKASKERSADSFHVCQAVLTPGTSDIMQKLGSNLQAECAAINRKFPQWVESEALTGCKGMVFIADFVEEGDFVQSVVSRNK